ncbi:MAG: pirin-like C-terminal cupin domain-containing protein [Myxococcota bacterium]|nr:pirin-like C-terminal cupin domain-containing protein [Myxococcota bacterium]
MSITINFGIEIAADNQYGALRLIPRVVGQPIDPLLRMDIFSYGAPYFDSRPHAGYATIMYLFKDTLGQMECQSGIHAPISVKAGELNWYVAGRGLNLKDSPVVDSEVCSGALLYVKLPASEEVNSPRHKLVSQSEAIELQFQNVSLRLLFGQYLNHHVGIFGLQYALIEATVEADASISIPDQWSAVLFLIEGDGYLNGQAWHEEQFVSVVEENEVTIKPSAVCRILIFMGQPNQEPLYWEGPFAMSSKERINMVRNAYKLGFIDPILTP